MQPPKTHDPLAEAMIHILETNFPDAEIDLSSRDNDGVHYSLVLHTNAFEGKTLLAQQRWVCELLKEYVGLSVHALSMTTGTLK
ncbi:MAG: BolA/IbaG family iron-sulfur metabolism protein [Alphaproteobacteria bacterium]|nr:BolA/IbaG family iron-sulfur metabolism protein [Alphaproteobacteria bacterium]